MAGAAGTEAVRAAAERAARTSYGRLVAILAAGTRDIALAEDALADAFERALRTWPESGVPGSPEGWLLTVARHRQSDVMGSAARRTSVPLPDAGEGRPELPARSPRPTPSGSPRDGWSCCSPARTRPSTRRSAPR